MNPFESVTVENASQRSTSSGLLVVIACLCLVGGAWFYVEWYPFSNVGALVLAFLPVALGIRALLPKTGGFENAEISVVVVIIAILSSMLTQGMYCGTGRVTQCRSNLKQIGLALHNYHEVYGTFPPSVVYGSDGQPLHSWRVLILPYMDAGDLYDRYRFNESWDGPHNRELFTEMPRVYGCPEVEENQLTSYVAVTGQGTMWPETGSFSVSENPKPGEVIMVTEIAGFGVHWLEPRDLPVESMQMQVTGGDQPSVSSHHRNITWGEPLLGANVLLADGRVRFLDRETTDAEIRSLVQLKRAGDVESPAPAHE